jgi:hypothetical protein
MLYGEQVDRTNLLIRKEAKMAMKLNCWEFKKCGKEPGGAKLGEHDVCPAATEAAANTLNGGTNGGRICWIIAHSKYCGKVKCSDMQTENSCFQCEFRYKVMMEEGLINTCNATGILLSKHATAGVC